MDRCPLPTGKYPTSYKKCGYPKLLTNTQGKPGGNLVDPEKAHPHLRIIRTHTINKNRCLQIMC